MSTPGVTPPEPGPATSEQRTVAIRRTPRYQNFLLLGVMLGIIAALAVTFLLPGDPAEKFSKGQIFGFFALLFIALGVGLMGLIAVFVDRAASRRAGTAVVDHRVTVAAAEPSAAPAVPESSEHGDAPGAPAAGDASHPTTDPESNA